MKFVILSHQRTGSNMLRQMLNQHDDISCGPELELKIWSEDDVKKWVNTGKRAEGYLLKYDQANYGNLIGKKIIHLKRKNKLATVLSRMAGSGNNRRVPFEADIQAVGFEILRIENFEGFFNTLPLLLFKDTEYLEVFYEDLLFTKEREMKRIFDFLRVEKQDLEFIGAKLNPEVKEMVTNFEELKLAFPKYV